MEQDEQELTVDSLLQDIEPGNKTDKIETLIYRDQNYVPSQPDDYHALSASLDRHAARPIDQPRRDDGKATSLGVFSDDIHDFALPSAHDTDMPPASPAFHPWNPGNMDYHNGDGVEDAQSDYRFHRELIERMGTDLERLNFLEIATAERLGRVQRLKQNMQEGIQRELNSYSSRTAGKDSKKRLMPSPPTTNQDKEVLLQSVDHASDSATRSYIPFKLEPDEDEDPDTIICQPAKRVAIPEKVMPGRRSKRKRRSSISAELVVIDEEEKDKIWEPEPEPEPEHSQRRRTTRNSSRSPNASNRQTHKAVKQQRPTMASQPITQNTHYHYPVPGFRPVLAPKSRYNEPDYVVLPRDADPQIDDAEATRIIQQGVLKGNKRHRAAPDYFRRKGYLYADKYYILEQVDGEGNLLINAAQAVGSYDTNRYAYDDLEDGTG